MLPTVWLFVCRVKNVFVGFLPEENPHGASVQLARVAPRCSQILQLCLSPNTFKTRVGSVQERGWGISRAGAGKCSELGEPRGLSELFLLPGD